jgi:CheY-like chemotaxis protein
MTAGTNVVLLVEDEPMLRRVVALTLRADGFRVLEAGDGSEALATLQSEPDIDILLTDVRMPGMSGYELAGAALSARPGMPVMLMTGYSDEEMPPAIREAMIPLLRKPFNFATLAESVRTAMKRD